MAIFVHIKRQVVICYRLNFLNWYKTIFELDCELALQFGLVCLLDRRRVSPWLILHILKIVLFLEVLIETGFHLDSTE